MSKIFAFFSLVILGAFNLGLSSQPAQADAVYQSFLGVAINGYDPVAYFTEGKPQEGDSDHKLDWNGATWHFKSAANKSEFETSPEKYAPQFGGYCAWAVSQGYTATTIPEAWDIVDNKLYLNFSLGVQSNWKKDRDANIVAANKNWPKIRDK